MIQYLSHNWLSDVYLNISPSQMASGQNMINLKSYQCSEIIGILLGV